ncbi:hypothetical protein FISHEDRAFT_33844 [Fistulina hepatica ATCC 64428]|uniref:Uncharacterized protein n=1 Tax=Fistulina hepatica ATCC 64428 TaxID=1128425 RepID=A0A0D7AP41_9AGAR|nr:hypothetical protein FISHEDRAFT_33844 [Fistulina hepatica ATCC 64428]
MSKDADERQPQESRSSQDTSLADPESSLFGGSLTIVEILNELFPTEASLANAENVHASLSQEYDLLLAEVKDLRAQLKLEQDPTNMQRIQEMIADLLSQMSRIREKATESEAVVRNITKDIQALDLAKKNLIYSMTTLKRLHMLVNSLSQLEELVRERRYADVAQTLSAAKELQASFKSFTSVRRISHIWRRLQEIQGSLRTRLDEDFDAFFLQDPSKIMKPATMSDACAVVDVIGQDMRIHIIDRYLSVELKEYRRIFRPTDEAGQLDNLSRRFAWFRRTLMTHETEQGRIFPSEWRVSWHLAARFSDITRDDLSTLLTKADKRLTVKVLLDNLQATVEFETSLGKKWAVSFKEILNTASESLGRPHKSMSSAFEPHMGIFVDAQDRALADMLAPHRKLSAGHNPTRSSLDIPSTIRQNVDEGDTPASVLPSSTELFYFYGQSLDQCAKFTTGKPLYDLAMLHKKWLKIYADDVLGPCLKRGSVSQSRKSTEARLDINRLRQAAIVINTADYCHATALELEDKMKGNVDEAFKRNVTLQDECDLFISVISSAIAVMLREFEIVADPAFLAMIRISWSGERQVSGPSSYTTDLISATEQLVEFIRPLIDQNKYLRNFLDKASSLVFAKFTTALVKTRPIKEAGAEQLLLDLQTIKGRMLKLPGEALVTTGYSRSVNKMSARLDTLLKVIVTPVDPADQFILNYTVLIGDDNFSNFQKVLDLKGTPKTEQNALLDTFLTITSTKPDLKTSSFLSSLDMDPQSVGNLASPLPILFSAVPGGGDGLFSGLASPPSTSPGPGEQPAIVGPGIGRPGGREVFSDFRRFVSFGLRRQDTQPLP